MLQNYNTIDDLSWSERIEWDQFITNWFKEVVGPDTGRKENKKRLRGTRRWETHFLIIKYEQVLCVWHFTEIILFNPKLCGK